jgi:hypothetical protein
MATRIINLKEAHDTIKALEDGRFFTVVFTKRTTGEVRVMNCRQRVTKHLRGGDAAYSFSAHSLCSTYDMVEKGYRCFPLDGLIEIRIDGDSLIVDNKIPVA